MSETFKAADVKVLFRTSVYPNQLSINTMFFLSKYTLSASATVYIIRAMLCFCNTPAIFPLSISTTTSNTHALEVELAHVISQTNQISWGGEAFHLEVPI